jgi:V-type H+-transporting ATPase subunit e
MAFTNLATVGVASVIAAFVGWIMTPAGKDQTTWRTAIAMTIGCLYVMWALTYLAQMHPLIAPRRSDLRTEHTF